MSDRYRSGGTYPPVSNLPKLIPITRREPPPGYVAPDYRALEALPGPPEKPTLELDLEDEYRLLEARKATRKALTSYRWWGFTALLYRFRLWMQARHAGL